MHFSEKESLSYLQENGFTLSDRHFRRIKKKIDTDVDSRLEFIAKQGFKQQHIDRITNLEYIQSEYYRLHIVAKSKGMIREQIDILEKIAVLQPYISEYYASTAKVFGIR